MVKADEHAVVIGCGFAGLFAAGVLAEHFSRVTVVEKDELHPVGAPSQPRRGVPQGSHPHGLLTRGIEIFEELMPGFCQELVELGAVEADAMSNFRVSYLGHTLSRPPGVAKAVLATRPFIEAAVRRFMCRKPGIEFLPECKALGFQTISAGDRVSGVRVASNYEKREWLLPADFVVCAPGRTRLAAAWLEEIGYSRPPEERLPLNLSYVSRHFRLQEGALGADKACLSSPSPTNPRGWSLLQQEHGSWVFSLQGYGPWRPPANADQFWKYASGIVPSDILELVRHKGKPLDEFMSYNFPSNVWQHYERLEKVPDRLVIMGDSLCSINPLHGGGITHSAEQALVLKKCLSQGTRRLPHRFYRGAAHTLRIPWMFSAAIDTALQDSDRKQPLHFQILSRYLERLLAIAEHDDSVTCTFFRTIGKTATPAELFQPSILWKVLKQSV